MAMAAVRFAARRLTALQPQAILRSVVANEQRVVNRGGYALRRFTSSEVSAANGTKISNQLLPSVSEDRRLMAADQKKEELFHLLDEIQRNKDILYTGRKKDRWLLQSLASHVNHRPQWHWYLVWRRVELCLGATASFFAFLYMVEKCILPRTSKFREQTVTAGVSCAEQNIDK